MDTAAIETFLAVAHGKNMTAVSKQLFVSQSTISLRLGRLEEELGKKLIIRSKGVRGVTLTEDGVRFIPIAERWIALLDDTKSFGRNVPAHKLQVGGTGTINSTLLSDFLLKFIRENPAFSISHTSSKSQQTISMVDTYLLDIGFTHRQPSGKNKNLVSRPAYREKMYLACSQESSFAADVIETSSLIPENEIFLVWSEDTTLWRNRIWGADIDRKVYTVDLNLRLRLMENPEFWTLCPSSLVNMYSSYPGVRICSFSEPPPDIEIYAVTRAKQSESLVEDVEYFLEQFTDYIKELKVPGLCC